MINVKAAREWIMKGDKQNEKYFASSSAKNSNFIL